MRDVTELGLRGPHKYSPKEADFRELENAVGTPLPEDYIRFLRHTNGGTPRLNAFVPRYALRQEGAWPINLIFWLTPKGQKSHGSLWSEMRFWKTAIPPGALPIADDGLGNVIYLDLKSSPAPVYILAHDSNESNILVAKDFGEFIDLLYKPEPIKLEGDDTPG